MAGSLITDRVKQLVRMRGPVIPSQISKEIGTNILMASAILSELASKNDVKISSVKVGGTPLYYVSGQESKLQNYLAGLPQKEREAFDQLKSAGVLMDTSLEPAIRFALRQIKDFAKPLEVSIDGESKLFWKWYLLPNEEAEPAIKKMLGFNEEKAAPIEPAIGTQATILSSQPLPQSSQQQLQPITKVAASSIKIPEQQSQLVKASKKKAASQPTASEFTRFIDDFFAKNSIEVESSDVSGKSEANYVVTLPSPVGKLRYYCIVKNKKTCTDSDISTALLKGQLKKLPILLLTKGELTKKAQELLSKEIGPLVVKKI